MSYTDLIPEQERSSYEVIDDWNEHLNERIAEEHLQPLKPLVSLTFSNKIINSEVMFWGGVIGVDMRFQNCYFKKNIGFNETKFKSLSLSNCFIDDSFSLFLDDNVFEEGISIMATLIKESFLVVKGTFSKFCFWNIGDVKKCMIVGGSFTELNLSVYERPIGEFILGGKDLTGLIRIIGNTGMNRVELKNPAKGLYLTMEDIIANNISIVDYKNDGSLRLSNITPFNSNSEFSIAHSYLGKAEFYSVNLKSFTTVSITDSHLVDCIFVNTVFPNHIYALKGKFENESDEETELRSTVKRIESGSAYLRKVSIRQNQKEVIRNYFSKKRETLRQIKYAFGKQGDTVNEQRFHSLEMQALYRSLSFRNNFWTKTIIKASALTSNFGQSVLRPILFLLLGH